MNGTEAQTKLNDDGSGIEVTSGAAIVIGPPPPAGERVGSDGKVFTVGFDELMSS